MSGRNLLERAVETAGLASLLVARDRTRAARVYTLLSERQHLGRRTMYLNLGYWDGATDYDDACDALAEQLGRAAGLSLGDEILDVGFGFGDQDDYWMRRFSPARILGLNVTPLHVETARGRFPNPRLDFRLGSATATGLPDASFDRVTALECAFHFVTREDFFREAFRVLRPGGTLATADILPAREGRTAWERLFLRAGKSFWQIPEANWYGPDTYARKLREAGFAEVEVRSIREAVYRPFWRAARERFADPEVGRRWNPLAHWATRLDEGILDTLDYVIATARRGA